MSIEEISVTDSKILPGKRLKNARENMQLSIEEVAEQLRLRPEFLRAIEADNYKQTPPKAFVRGYLRAYARLLNLSQEEIVAAFDELDVTDAEPEFSTQRIYGEKKTVSVRTLPWLTASVIFAIFIILIGLWYSLHESHKSMQQLNSLTNLPDETTTAVDTTTPATTPNTIPNKPENKSTAQTSTTAVNSAGSNQTVSINTEKDAIPSIKNQPQQNIAAAQLNANTNQPTETQITTPSPTAKKKSTAADIAPPF